MESSDQDTSQTCSNADAPEANEAANSKRRKSSRLKDKMCKQTQDVASSTAGDSYNLRLSSLVKRVQMEQRKTTPKQPKGKSKPPPLSKYRRRTANARERMRMQEINEGFERLRQCLPNTDQDRGKKADKPTKFTILSLALNYIHSLRNVLGYPSAECSSCTGPVHNEESDLGSDAASLRTPSVSSVSCDDSSSTFSPSSAAPDLKECESPSEVSCVPGLFPKDLSRGQNSLAGSGVLMDLRDTDRCSPTSSASDISLSPSPPPLSLPEDCMDLDQSDLLNITIPFPTLADIEDIIA